MRVLLTNGLQLLIQFIKDILKNIEITTVRIHIYTRIVYRT